MNFPVRSAMNVIELGFPNVRVMRIDDTVWSVVHLDDGAMEIEQWPYRRVKYHAEEWLDSLGCQDAVRHLT